MRKSFLTKAIVAVGVMVSTIALSFVITMAGTSTETYEYTVSPSTNTKDFFTASSSSISQTDFTTESLQTNGYVVPDRTPSLTVTSALKLNSNGYLSFSLSEGETAELTFYVGGKKDGKAYSTQVLKDNVKVATYPTSGKYDVDSVNKLTYSASGAGTYTIKQSASEQCLYYAKLVVTSQTSDEAGATLTASTNSINVGNSLQLTPKFTNFTATSGAYESNNLGVATVDENGLIRAISQGTATITYTANGVGTLDSSVTELTATFDVTVNDPYVSSATTWDFSEFTEQIDLEGTNFTTSYSKLTLVGNSNGSGSKDYVSSTGFHTNGGSNSTRRYISLTPSINGILSATFISNNSSEGRTCFIGTSINTNTTNSDVVAYKTGTSGTVKGKLNANTTYYIYVNNGITIQNITFTPTVADKLVSIDNEDFIVNNSLECTPLYAKVNGMHYFVLDFAKNSALANANTLTYTATGKTPKTITTLYTGVKFDADGNDVLSEDDHLYYAFKFDSDEKTYTSVDATISVSN